MKVIQRKVIEPQIRLCLFLTEEENNRLYTELENLKMPAFSKSLLEQIHRNMLLSDNVNLEE